MPAALIHVRVSREFLDDYVQRTVQRRRPVRDNILGTRIFGESNTAGEMDLVLRPSPDKLLGEIAFVGTVDSRTVGYNGPAILHSSSKAAFRAGKQVTISGSGLHVAPATASVSTSTQTNHIETTLPRLRGRIARRIAWRRVGNSRSQAEAISSQHTAAIIRNDLDKRIDQAVAKMQQEFRVMVAELPMDRVQMAVHTNFRTTSEYVELAMIRNGATAEEKRLRPPQINGNPHVAIRVNRVLLRHALADPEFNQTVVPLLAKIFKTRLAEQAIALVNPVEEPRDESTKWSLADDWLTLDFTDVGPEPSSLASVSEKP